MKKLGLLAIAGVALTLGAAQSLAANEAIYEEHDARIIVELDTDTQHRSKNSIINEQNLVLSHIRNYVTPSFEIAERYTNVLNGFVLEINAAHVDNVRELPDVARVNYDRAHAVRKIGDDEHLILHKAVEENEDPHKDGNSSTDTMEKPENTKEGEGVLIAILDSGYLLEHEAFTALPGDVKTKVTKESLKPIINANDFHGKPGTGPDKTTYYNSKVPFYYDYGGETNKTAEGGPADWDVFSDLSDHGTHVASTAAASGPYKGVAPKAQLALMKVFTEYYPTEQDKKDGWSKSIGAYDTAIINALEDAAAINADIVSLSLGTDLNDFDSQSIVVQLFDKLQEKGIYASVAAGNAGKDTYNKFGPYKNWTTDTVETGIMSTYQNADSPVIVGAAQPDRQFYEQALLINGRNVAYEDQVINYVSNDGPINFDPERHLSDITSNGTITDFNWVKIPGWGEEKDYKNLDVEGKIAVIDRGNTTFLSKVNTARTHKAIAAAIIDNDPSKNEFNFRMDFGGTESIPIPVISILNKDKDAFDGPNDQPLKIIVNKIADNPTARRMADFSSDGATFDLSLKPDIATPGLNVKGAVIETPTSYKYMNGTSMATPNYSGALALLMSEDPTNFEYKKTLAMRSMSTAKPMKDTKGNDFASPRQQGSGLMDIGSALNTKVYLEGLDEEGNGIAKSKIQLRNNEAISKGNINLKFIAHNETKQAIDYNVKTYVFKPGLEVLPEEEIEKYPKFKDVKFQTTNDELIKTVEQKLTIKPGSNEVILNPIALTEQEKATINKDFQYGTYLEGYAIFTPVEEKGNEILSIPYMGFFGDYGAQEPIEPFSFEKDPNKVYGSDLLNTVADRMAGMEAAEFGSAWVQGYNPKMKVNAKDELDNTIDIMPVILNETNLFQMKDGNKNAYKPVTVNPLTGVAGSKTDIYAGNARSSNTMILQQFVNRSVATNIINVVRKVDGTSIHQDVFIDPFFGSMELKENGQKFFTYPLGKSHIDADLLGGNIVAHRALAILPLYDIDTQRAFPDGEYEIQMMYLMSSGNYTGPGSDEGIYVKKYNLHMDSKAPRVQGIENVSKDGKDYIRVTYKEINMAAVAINGTIAKVEPGKKGTFYVDFERPASKTKVFLRGIDMANGEAGAIFHTEDEHKFLLESPDLTLKHDFRTKITNNATLDNTIDITLFKDNRVERIDGAVTLAFQLFEGYTPEDTRLFAIDKNGDEIELEPTISDEGYVVVRTNSLKVRVVNDSFSAGSDLVWIIPTAVGGSLVAIGGTAAVVLVLIKKKKIIK